VEGLAGTRNGPINIRSQRPPLMHHQVPCSGMYFCRSFHLRFSFHRAVPSGSSLHLVKEVEGRPDITIDLSAPGALESLKNKPFTIKEGCTYQMKATFVVQHQVLSGLKYVQLLKRKGVRVSKDQEMIGSYPPNTTDRPLYTKSFAPEEAPTGMLARGHYEAVSRFVDDDDVTHLKFEWSFNIAKDWH